MHNQATPPVKIIGVGGAGSRVVTLLVRDGLGSVEFLQLDANSQDWDSSVGPERLLIGEHTRPRPFCRLNSQWVHRAMRDDEKSVREALAGAGLLIVVAGMGGNIASAAPIVARMGKECGAVVVAVLGTPFPFEGKNRQRKAEAGIEALGREDCMRVTIPCERLFPTFHPKITLGEAYQMADAEFCRAIRDVVENWYRTPTLPA